MRGDLTTYAGRAKRRPPGASTFTQRLYRLLHEHPEGLTRDEIHGHLREGWMETDAYRAYSRMLAEQRKRDRARRLGRHEGHGTQDAGLGRHEGHGTQDAGLGRHEGHGTQDDPEFKRRAQVWWIGDKLRGMNQRGNVRREEDRWFAGKPPRVRGVRGTYVLLDPEESRAVLTTTNAAHIERENAKAELLALLNDRTIKNPKAKAHAQAAYDWLCGRKQQG